MHLQEVSSTFCHFDEMAPQVTEISFVYALDVSHEPLKYFGIAHNKKETE